MNVKQRLAALTRKNLSKPVSWTTKLILSLIITIIAMMFTFYYIDQNNIFMVMIVTFFSVLIEGVIVNGNVLTILRDKMKLPYKKDLHKLTKGVFFLGIGISWFTALILILDRGKGHGNQGTGQDQRGSSSHGITDIQEVDEYS